MKETFLSLTDIKIIIGYVQNIMFSKVGEQYRHQFYEMKSMWTKCSVMERSVIIGMSSLTNKSIMPYLKQWASLVWKWLHSGHSCWCRLWQWIGLSTGKSSTCWPLVSHKPSSANHYMIWSLVVCGDCWQYVFFSVWVILGNRIMAIYSCFWAFLYANNMEYTLFQMVTAVFQWSGRILPPSVSLF